MYLKILNRNMNLNKLEILQEALQIRYFEQSLLEEYKKGAIHGTVHTCIGQEIFPCILSKYTSDYYWFSNHRGHGHYIAKTRDFEGLASEILLKEDAVAAGVGGSQHLKNDKFISNGVQGGQTGIAAGYSSEINNKDEYKSVMFLGDGTLGTGHIYEAFNLASLYNSKTIFVLEDNKVAQSTPSSKTFAGNIEKIIRGFGIEYYKCDGNNFDSMVNAIEEALSKYNIPTFLHLETNRLSSHSKSDDNRDENFIKELEEKDILNIMIKSGELSYESDYIKEVQNIFMKVTNKQDNIYTNSSKINKEIEIKFESPKTGIKFSEHINESLDNFLKENNNAIILGEDIEDDPFNSGKIYGGAFKVTKGLSTKYSSRVISMPISESGFTGFATGISLRPQFVIVEIMFADFLSQNFDQIFHQITKIPTIYGSKLNLPILIRAAGFAGNGYGPTHSSSMENIYYGLPNLDIHVPNLYFDYSNILESFKNSKSPTLVIEPKSLYTKKMNEKIYSEYSIEIQGFSTIVKPNKRKPQATIFAYGPELDFTIQQLEYLATEHEIYINVFSPVKISKPETKEFKKLLQESEYKLININQSILNSNIGNHWLAEVLKEEKINYYNSNSMYDWIPTGRSEKSVLIKRDQLVDLLMGKNE